MSILCVLAAWFGQDSPPIRPPQSTGDWICVWCGATYFVLCVVGVTYRWITGKD